MNKGSIIVNINSIKDIEKINKDTKYINISIDNVDIDVIDYFLVNGKDYLYSDSINNINGYIYVDYDMFVGSEKVINNVIDSMPSNLSNIEKIRYVYIYLGKILSSDINTIEDKNEVISFSNISTINNIWGSINRGKTNDITVSKIFMYILNRIGIKSELINSSVNCIGNKIYLEDNKFIVVNLFNDLAYIQGGFCLRFFDKYNSDKRIDKKLGYISDEYTDYYLNKTLSDIDLLESNVVEIILSLTEKIIDIDSIGTLELSKIYGDIFDKYLPNYDVRINNFYVVDSSNKKHFIVINYGEEYYSYNYNKKCFMKVKYEDIYKNLENHLIGLYNDENFIKDRKEVRV